MEDIPLTSVLTDDIVKRRAKTALIGSKIAYRFFDAESDDDLRKLISDLAIASGSVDEPAPPDLVLQLEAVKPDNSASLWGSCSLFFWRGKRVLVAFRGTKFRSTNENNKFTDLTADLKTVRFSKDKYGLILPMDQLFDLSDGAKIKYYEPVE